MLIFTSKGNSDIQDLFKDQRTPTQGITSITSAVDLALTRNHNTALPYPLIIIENTKGQFDQELKSVSKRIEERTLYLNHIYVQILLNSDYSADQSRATEIFLEIYKTGFLRQNGFEITDRMQSQILTLENGLHKVIEQIHMGYLQINSDLYSESSLGLRKR